MDDRSTEKQLATREINNRLIFRFFQAANTMHTKGTQAMEEFGITTQQWSIMGALTRPQAAEGMSVSELSRFLLVSRQNLTGILSRLERDGNIGRVAGADDRRQRRVRLTPKGEALWKAIAAPVDEFYEHSFKGFTFDDKMTFIHYINLLQKNMAGAQP